MAINTGLLGDKYLTVDKCVCVPIERYDELIKKESFYDELMKNNTALLLLQSKIIEGGKKNE